MPKELKNKPITIRLTATQYIWLLRRCKSEATITSFFKRFLFAMGMPQD